MAANGVMGFPAAPPNAQSSMYQRLLGGLLGRRNYGGLLTPEEEQAAQQQGLLALGANLMAAGGPSDRPVGLGQAIGSSLMAGQQATQNYGQDMLKAMLLKTKLRAAGQTKPPKRYVVKGALVDEDGNPIYQSPATATGDGIGDYQPGNYTPASWAKFVKSKDPLDLERYVTPRQEYSPSYQYVSRTLPDGSTQQGTFDTRSGITNWIGEVVPPGAKAEAEATGREKGKITGQRSGKAPTAYAAFQIGTQSLEEAMSATSTGPVAGRIPAVTAAQQVAEGAEATMAPVLKQLFRDSGEGTFTDSDQALLMKMVPTRTDHPEARKAKIEMIDGIVRAKLGIDAAATTAPMGVGQTTTINGVKVKRVK